MTSILTPKLRIIIGMVLLRLSTLSLGLFAGGTALGAGGPGAKFINYYQILLSKLGVEGHAADEWIPVIGGFVSLAIITTIGLIYSSAMKNADISPPGRFSIAGIVDALLSFVQNLTSSILGEKPAATFLPLLASLFIFILISNLTGLVPGFIPATESINTNVAMALSVFVVYNIAGIKEHGGSYVKQFIGPVAFLAPLMVVIELIAHLARPMSLSLRLYGNIFGDHLVLSVFTGLTYLILPAFLLFFGLLVASLQSFVFTLLSSIYIALAISHDH